MGFGIDIVADSLCASLIKFCSVLNERSFKIEAFFAIVNTFICANIESHILMSEFISVKQTPMDVKNAGAQSVCLSERERNREEEGK